jgi:hypothetical protein
MNFKINIIIILRSILFNSTLDLCIWITEMIIYVYVHTENWHTINQEDKWNNITSNNVRDLLEFSRLLEAGVVY